MKGRNNLLMNSPDDSLVSFATSRPPSATSHQVSEERPSAFRTALAGLIGNVLEWFDFAVYGYFATDIGREFFPKSNASAQQLLAFGVFAVGFFARPIGSLALGWVGDRTGRRALLTLSIALMGVATLAMGLLPTYAQIGAAAPMLLITMRVIQGFSVGGEFTGSMVFTTEAASSLTRGLISSSTAAGVTIGFILGSGSAWAINALLSPEQLSSWGWRIPFIGSVLFCIVGWILRRGLHETSEGLKAKTIRPPLISSLIADWLPILQTFGILATTNAAYYLTFTYIVDRRKGLSGEGSIFLLANTLTLIFVLIVKPFGGWLSDCVGRRKLMLIMTLAIIVLISFIQNDALRHTAGVCDSADLTCRPDRYGAWTPRCDAGRDFPAPHACHVNEHRL